MSKIKPLGNYVLVTVIEEPEKTESGLIIPDSAREKPQKGKVISVGAGELQKDGTYTNIPINEGDVVMFVKNRGMDVKEDGTQYKILTLRDILATVT